MEQEQQRIKVRGTREEVWAGTAQKTSGGLHKEDLVLNKRGVIVSRKQSETAKAKYPALKAKLCGSASPGDATQTGLDSTKWSLPHFAEQNLPVSPASPGDETLVYFGAGWDMLPLGKADFKRFKRHLYIDALPKLAHYEPGQPGFVHGKDLPSFIGAIKAGLKKYHLVGEPIQRGDQWIFNLSDGRYVEYWVNTTVEEALANPYLRGELRKAKWLHIKGFHPRFDAKAYMPNMYANLAELRAA